MKNFFSLLAAGDLRFDPSSDIFYHKGLAVMAVDATFWPELVAKVRTAFKEEWRAVPLSSMAVPL